MGRLQKWFSPPRSLPGALCLLAVATLSACQGAAPSGICKLALVTSVPLRPVNGHLHVDLLLDGKKADMVLDTGASSTVLSTEALGQLGLFADSTGLRGGGIGGRQNVGLVRTETFQLGTLSGRHLHVFAQDLGPRSANFHADGLLGADILSQYDLDLDTKAMSARLYSTSGDCSSPVTVLAGALYTVPLVSPGNVYDRRPVIHVTIGGRQLTALLDTGAARSTIYYTSARRLGLVASELGGDRKAIARGAGPHAVRETIHVFEPISIGPLTLQNAPIGILDQASDNGIDMLLGGDFISRVHLWLSYSSHTLIMQYPPHAASPPA